MRDVRGARRRESWGAEERCGRGEQSQRKLQKAARARHQKQAAAAEDRSPVHISLAYPGGGVQIDASQFDRAIGLHN